MQNPYNSEASNCYNAYNYSSIPISFGQNNLRVNQELQRNVYDSAARSNGYNSYHQMRQGCHQAHQVRRCNGLQDVEEDCRNCRCQSPVRSLDRYCFEKMMVEEQMRKNPYVLKFTQNASTTTDDFHRSCGLPDFQVAMHSDFECVETPPKCTRWCYNEEPKICCTRYCQTKPMRGREVGVQVAVDPIDEKEDVSSKSDEKDDDKVMVDQETSTDSESTNSVLDAKCSASKKKKKKKQKNKKKQVHISDIREFY